MKTVDYIQLFKVSFFVTWCKRIGDIMLLAAGALLIFALNSAILQTTTDIQQGEYYRIIFIHVPAAWTCMLLYLILTVLSILFLITLHPILMILIRSTSILGGVYTLITLITGSLWGYPMWGTFWVWDARLTSVLILLFIYIAHILIIIRDMVSIKNSKVASYVAIIGFVNIPIIKYSVEWWTTLHQGPSIIQKQSAIDLNILTPLIIVFISYMLFTSAITLYTIKKEVLTKRIQQCM